MTIMDILVKDAVILNLGVRSKTDVLAEMAAALAKVEPQIEGERGLPHHPGRAMDRGPDQ